MDAVTLLRNDHRTVEKLFKEFEKLEKQDGKVAKRKQRAVVDQIIRELSVHVTVEEDIFYPAVRAEMEDQDDTILEAFEEHHVAKWVLSELEKLSEDAERFEAKTTVLIELVRHHVEEEEQELFPAVREEIKRKRLIELADQMEQAKKIAPKYPRPEPARGATRGAKATKRVSRPRGTPAPTNTLLV